jgi:hypothetical protein
MFPYVTVDEPENWIPARVAERRPSCTDNGFSGAFYRLKGLKIFISLLNNNISHRETLFRALDRRRGCNTLIIGPVFAGRQDALYRYCGEMNGDFPFLRICFGNGGLTALTDAWSPRIRALASSGAADAEEIQRLWEFLFRERLREELSDFIIRKARHFFILLLEFYTSAARRKRHAPVLMLENIHLAENSAAEICIDAYAGIKNMSGLMVLGTCDDEEMSGADLRKWKPVFPWKVKLNKEGMPPPRLPEIPAELLEIACALSLLGRYYPASLFFTLFEEEGKSPAMISRALSLLVTVGIIDTPDESLPWMADFIKQAEAVLGEQMERVRALIRRRLLAWVEQKKLSPCFRLLVILANMGGGAALTDQLILMSVTSDLINGTAAGIERARDAGILENLAGPERAAAVRSIFETSRALITGNEAAIRAAFVNIPPDCAAFPVLKARILVNLSAFHLGLRDAASALETIKEAILLSQGRHKYCLAQSYRLFSLVSLSKQQIGETADYLGFAIDDAEKTGNYHELGVSSYYAAAAQFLFGNMSKAAWYARKAREQALAAGCSEWADRSRFLEGRLAFETGSYQEAMDMFENLHRDPFGGLSAEKERLLAAWAYRARVYHQNPLSPKPENGGLDADLFEVEAAYLAGNYHKVVELAQVLINPHQEESFLYTEQPDWRSGFAQCEFLYFSRGELRDRMLCVYHSLALCRISASGGEEAMHNMQRVIHNERLSEMDPWDAFYFYAWYRILEQTGAGQVDMNTAVSIAFKRLQRRASRIDDIEVRRQYLTQPRWNSALSLAAREFKLI